MLRVVFALVMLHVAQVALGSPAEEEWRVTVPGKIAWHEVTELGNLLVATGKGFYGVDSVTGAISWVRPEFTTERKFSVEPVPGSPFYKLTRSGEIYLLDPLDGRTIFDSTEAGVAEVEEIYFLYARDSFLVKGKSNILAEALTVMVDMKTGKTLWRESLDLGKVLAVQSIAGDHVLVVTLFDIFSIDRSTGDVAWRVPTIQGLQMTKSQQLNQLMMRFAEEVFKDDNVAVNVVQSPGGEEMYLAVGSLSEANATHISIDPLTGSRNWTRELSGTYPAFQILRPNGILTLPYYYDRDTFVLGGNRVNLLDYSSGAGAWGKKGKGLKVKGGITNLHEVDGGLLLSSYTGKKSLLYLLNAETGTFARKKPVNVDGRITDIFETRAGLVCYSSDEINLLDIKSGKFGWKKPVTSTPGFTAMKDHMIFAYDTRKKVVQSIDTRSGKVEKLNSKKVSFEGKEKPTTIEVRDDGVLLSSSQNMILLGFDGNTVYEKYYPAPRRPGWLRALYYAQGIRAAIASAESYYVTGSLLGASLTPEYKKVGKGARSVLAEIGTAYGEHAEQARGVAAESFRKANERFKATRITADSRIMLSKLEKSIALVKVGKADGEIQTTLDLGNDREPNYVVDAVTNQIYMKVGDSAIASYRL